MKADLILNFAIDLQIENMLNNKKNWAITPKP